MRLIEHARDSSEAWTSTAGILGRPKPPWWSIERPDRFLPPRNVRELMRPRPPTVPAELPLESALQLVAEEGTGYALVVNDDEDLVGILDLEVARAALDAEPSLDEPLEELRTLIGDGFHLESVLTSADVMEPYVQIARASWPAARALGLMKAEGVDVLPVVIEGDSRAIGIITRADLEKMGEVVMDAPDLAPYGAFRDGRRLPAADANADRDALIDQAEEIARSWLRTRPVGPGEPNAVTFPGVMLPVLSALYEQLVEHYSDFQEGPLSCDVVEKRPELATNADRLRLRQADAIAVLSHLMQQIRHDRRPDRDCLRKVEVLMEELRSIEAAESDLLYEAHYVDLPALD